MQQSANYELVNNKFLHSNIPLQSLDLLPDPEVRIIRLEEKCAHLEKELIRAELVSGDAQDRFDHLNKAIYILGRDIFNSEESLPTNDSDKNIGNLNVHVSTKSFVDMTSSLEGLGVRSENTPVCPQSPTPSHISLVSLSTDDAVSLGHLDVTESNFEMLSNACYMLKERLRLTTMEADSVVDDVNAANYTAQTAQSKTKKLTQMLKVLWNESFQYQKELKKVKKERGVLIKKVKDLLLIVNDQQHQISCAGINPLLPTNHDKTTTHSSPNCSKLKMQSDLIKSVELHEQLLKGIVLKRKNSPEESVGGKIDVRNEVLDSFECNERSNHEKVVENENEHNENTKGKGIFNPILHGCDKTPQKRNTSCERTSKKEITNDKTTDGIPKDTSLKFKLAPDRRNEHSFFRSFRGLRKSVLQNIDTLTNDLSEQPNNSHINR